MASVPVERTSLRQALRKYVEARQAALTEARRVLDINELDARALLFVADHPGARPTRLREYLGITSAGVTTLVDRLERRGIVRRDIDRKDRRVSHITLTMDLDAEPWSALTRFDRDFEAAIAASDAGDTAELAAALDALTTSVIESGH
jgi:DNA-binding MarR family transcriptional regulator